MQDQDIVYIVIDFNNIAIAAIDYPSSFWRNVFQFLFDSHSGCKRIRIDIFGSFDSNQKWLESQWRKIEHILKNPELYRLDWHETFIEYSIENPIPEYSINGRPTYDRDPRIIEAMQNFVATNPSCTEVVLLSGDSDFMEALSNIDTEIVKKVFGCRGHLHQDYFKMYGVRAGYIETEVNKIKAGYPDDIESRNSILMYRESFFNPFPLLPDCLSEYLMSG